MKKIEKNELISLMGDPNMLLPITVLNLSSRSMLGLKNRAAEGKSEIHFLGELLALSKHDLRGSSGLGVTSFTEIAGAVAGMGYRLAEGQEVRGLEFGGPEGEANIREVYQIPDDLPTPTEWKHIDGRDPFEISTSRKGYVPTREFTMPIAVDVPFPIIHPVTLAMIRKVCQHAFEVAVDIEIDFVRKGGQKADLKEALQQTLPFNMAANYETGSAVRVELSLDEGTSAMLKDAFIKKAAEAIRGGALKVFIAPVLMANIPR